MMWRKSLRSPCEPTSLQLRAKAIRDIKKARKSREDEGHDGSPRKEGRNREGFRANDYANSIAA